MEVKTTIFVKAWADFDIQYTHATLVHSEKFDIEELKREFCEMYNIPSFNGLTQGNFYDLTVNFVEFLKELHSFTELKGTEIYFTD